MRQRGVYEKVTGSGVWWIRYADATGRIRREKAGPKGAALALYRKRKTEALQGRKLPERLRQRTVTFSEIAHDALVHSRQNKRSYRDDLSRMGRLLGWFRTRSADSITPQDIERRLAGAAQEEGWAPATVNRYRSLLSLTYRLGIRNGKVNTNPAQLVQAKREHNVREGFIDDTQYSSLSQACTDLWLRALLAVGYTYGWRKSELLNMHVRQVDLPSRTISLQPGTTKNNEGRRVRMTEEAYQLLRACVRCKKPDDYVFSRNGATRIKDFAKAWRNLCQKARVGSLLFHDLRRSAVRNLERSGVPRSVAMKMTGHKTESVYRRYAIVSESDLVEATRKLEQHRNGRETGTPTDTRTDTGQITVGSGESACTH